MTDSSHQCPRGFTEYNHTNVRACRRTDTYTGCYFVMMDTRTGCYFVMMDAPYQYSRVCGRVRGYQYKTTNAFYRRSTFVSIDTAYVDGVSLTHGRPREHIWIFAAGFHEYVGVPEAYIAQCPCQVAGATQPPLFVENDYFCESGTGPHYFTSTSTSTHLHDFFYYDPLWDGAGCQYGFINTCCSFNSPPWFHKQLFNLTTNDIEMRVCRDDIPENEDVIIDIVEIYVQ